MSSLEYLSVMVFSLNLNLIYLFWGQNTSVCLSNPRQEMNYSCDTDQVRKGCQSKKLFHKISSLLNHGGHFLFQIYINIHPSGVLGTEKLLIFSWICERAESLSDWEVWVSDVLFWEKVVFCLGQNRHTHLPPAGMEMSDFATAAEQKMSQTPENLANTRSFNFPPKLVKVGLSWRYTITPHLLLKNVHCHWFNHLLCTFLRSKALLWELLFA